MTLVKFTVSEKVWGKKVGGIEDWGHSGMEGVMEKEEHKEYLSFIPIRSNPEGGL